MKQRSPTITTTASDSFLSRLAKTLHKDHMRTLGIANTMKLAHIWNRMKFRRQNDFRNAQYHSNFDTLLRENGGNGRSPLEMRDGWALDSSMSLPFLKDVLAESEKLIAERGGIRKSEQGAYRSYFQDIWTPSDLEKYPAFLNFATSSELLAVVGKYLQSIPVLSTTLPSGVRVVESNAAYDDHPDEPHDSQLYHIDYYSMPNVYVLVLLRDTTRENGPWCFLPKSVSTKAARALGNWKRGQYYRFSDEHVYSVVDRKELIEFTYPRGTVLFIESSGCFHYGSRNAVKPRYQLMLGYSSLCRTDFTEAFMTQKVYPIKEGDSRLRKMVLNKNFIG